MRPVDDFDSDKVIEIIRGEIVRTKEDVQQSGKLRTLIAAAAELAPPNALIAMGTALVDTYADDNSKTETK